MARDIKTRFVLEGEQKFKSAMKDSANAIKLLNSEEKLAKAQFQQTGDAQKYAAQQAEILKQKIEEQKAAVAAAEEAIKQLTENGVSENSRQMQQWKLKLTDAQTALTRMETDLQNLGAESVDATSKTNELGDSLSSLDKKVSLDAVLKSVDRLSDGIGAALSKVSELAKGVVSELKDAASWADDLATQALIYGFDTQTLQRMQLAAELVDTDVETIVKSRQKLEQAMKAARPSLASEDFKKEKTEVNEYEKAFARLGVEIMRYGEYRNWDDVFWEAGSALMGVGNEVERDTIAMQLFGKSWRELLPLFTAGRAGYESAMEQAATVSDEDIDKLTALDDELQKLKNQFDTLEKTVFAQLAPALKDLASSLGSVLGELNEYLKTEEGQAMLQGLSEAVRGLFSDLTNTDFSSVLGTVKDALGKVTEGFAWIKENGGAVTGAVKGIVGAWMALKVTSGMTTVLQLISGMKGLLGIAGGKSPVLTPPVDATPKGAPATQVEGAAEGAATGGFAAKVLTSPAARAVGNFAASGAGDFVGAGAMAVMVAEDKLAGGRVLRDGGSIKEAVEAQVKEFETWQRGIDQNFQTLGDDWNGLLTEVGNTLSSLFGGKEDPAGDENALQPVTIDPEVKLPSKEELEQRMFEEFGTSDPVKLRIQMETNPIKPAGSDGYWSTGNPVDEMKDSVEDAAPALNQSMSTIGGNASAGLATGINARAGEAIAAAQALAAAVQAAIAGALRIASPSRVMMELGEYVGAGFAEGIESQLSTVNRAASRLAGAAVVDPSFNGDSRRSAGQAPTEFAVYMDSEMVASSSYRWIDGMFTEEIATVRR